MEDIKRTQIGIYENALSPDLCSQMIEWFEQKHNETGIGVLVDSKKRKDISIVPGGHSSWNNKFHIHVDASIRHFVKQYSDSLTIVNLDYPNYTLININNLSYGDISYKFQKSSAGGGFCQWHAEHDAHEVLMKRYIVFMFYLNTTNSGFTEFEHQQMRVRPKAGTLVLWPPYYTHPHRAAPDLQEDKYILTGWLHHP